MLLTLLLTPAFRHGQNECYVVTGFREGYTKTAHLSFKEPVGGGFWPAAPAIASGHARLGDRSDIVNFHAGTTSPRRAIWITVRTIARSISWRRSSRDSLLPLSMLSWQQTQIAAVAQSSAFRPIPLTRFDVQLGFPRSTQNTAFNLSNGCKPLFTAIGFLFKHHAPHT